jgi:sulfoxide reductase heme-binding subunit YedZ
VRFIGYLLTGIVGAVIGILFMSEMDWSGLLAVESVVWLTIRTSGIVAYLLLSASTILGLLTSSRILTRWFRPPVTLELHRMFSFLSLATLAIHVGALLLDQVESFTVVEVTVLFISNYRPFAVAAGILSGYISLLVSSSFYVRKHIKQQTWRMLHYSAFAAFALAAIHGIMAGSDSGTVGMQIMYLATGSAVLFLTLLRILGGRYIPVRIGPHETHAKTPGEPEIGMSVPVVN